MSSSVNIEKNPKVCVAGGAGFIGSHLAKRLKKDGYYVVCADWKMNEFMEVSEFCDEFLLLDLRNIENCLKATSGCVKVFNLAADMGGMGFIQSNHSVILYNNTMIDFNMLEAARRNGSCQTFFYSSSACVYPEQLQEDASAEHGLVESCAWPAKPQDAYGLEKIVTEELLMYYEADFGIQIRCARFHNIYGPRGTWRGGREKAPAAFIRKALTALDEIEMWGDGLARRSFCYIDDCVEGIIRITDSDVNHPLNLGSDQSMTMNQMMDIVLSFCEHTPTIKHIDGPEGVRGRNSDNTLIQNLIGWAPSIPAEIGLKKTFEWMKREIQTLRERGEQIESSSVIVT